MKIKSAIFDLDGTLVDSLMLWDVMWTKFGMLYRNDPDFRPDAKDDKAVRTMTLVDAMQYIHEIYSLGASGEDLVNTANEIMEKFYAEDVQLKPGVREFLDDCQANGVKMCIASATDMKLLRIALEHCDLEKYFPKIFSCAEIGKGKDCPDIYRAAQAYLGTTVGETWVFEDSAVALCTAHKLGMQTVGIYDQYNYGQDILRENANIYIDKDDSLARLIGMKKVVLLGDSIRLIGYGTVMQQVLGDRYYVWQPRDNCRFAQYLLLGMAVSWKDYWLDADVIHFNAGLWDNCDRFGDGPFTPMEAYAETILRIARIFMEKGKKVIFATTTPVDPRHPDPRTERIIAYNEAVVPNLREMGVVINDLYSLVAEDVAGNIREDRTHLSQKGIEICAAQTADVIRQVLAE